MKRILFLALLPVMVMGQTSIQEVVKRDMNVRNTKTLIFNSSYTAATVDTSEWYSMERYNSVYVAVQSKDSASCVIKYQTSLKSVGDEGETVRLGNISAVDGAKVQVKTNTNSNNYANWYAVINGTPYLVTSSTYSEDGYDEITLDRSSGAVAGQRVLLYQNYYPYVSTIATKDSLVAGASAPNGDVKVVDLSSQLRGVKSFRLIFGFNSGGKNGTTTNTYTALLTRKED